MNHHFELTNTIPVPNSRENRGRKTKYPFRVMKPGDSFFVEGAKKGTLYQAARKASERIGDRKFVVRAVIERGVHGTRVWRSE